VLSGAECPIASRLSTTPIGSSERLCSLLRNCCHELHFAVEITRHECLNEHTRARR
jgi:hypothetical protein